MFNAFLLNDEEVKINKRELSEAIRIGIESCDITAFNINDCDRIDLQLMGTEAIADVESLLIELNVFGMEGFSEFGGRVKEQMKKAWQLLIKLINYVRNYFSVYGHKRRQISSLYKKLSDALEAAGKLDVTTIEDKVSFYNNVKALDIVDGITAVSEFLKSTEDLGKLEPKFDGSDVNGFLNRGIEYIRLVCTIISGEKDAPEIFKPGLRVILDDRFEKYVNTFVKKRTREMNYVLNKVLKAEKVELSMEEFLKESKEFCNIVLGIENSDISNLPIINSDALDKANYVDNPDLKVVFEHRNDGIMVNNLAKACGLVTKACTQLHKEIIGNYFNVCKEGYTLAHDGLKKLPKELYN